MNFLSLNEDVLIYILSLISPKDAKNLGMTCRDSYAITMPRFLSSVALNPFPSYPVAWRAIHDRFKPSGLARARLFCNFMLADVEHRAPCLKELVLSPSAFLQSFSTDPEIGFESFWVGYSSMNSSDYFCGADFAKVLCHATRLKKIRIEYPEFIFATFPCILDALAALTSLEIIDLYYFGQNSLDLLQRMASRPQKLELLTEGQDTPYDEAYLRNFMPSLQVLRLSGCAEMLESYDADARWPLVHSLTLSGSTQRLSMSTLVRAFPSLRFVYFNCNLLEDMQQSACWSNLDHVELDSFVPLSFTVRRLCFRSGLMRPLLSWEGAPDALAQVASLIKRTSPVVLTFFLPLYRREIGQICDALSGVRYLQVVVKRHVINSYGYEIEAWIITSIALFAKQPLLGICFCVDAPFATSGPRKYCPLDPPRLQKLAESIAIIIPSLQYAGLDLTGGTDEYTTTWFRVVSRGPFLEESPRVQRLTQEEGLVIEEQLLNLDLRIYDAYGSSPDLRQFTSDSPLLYLSI
ncbi:hypothetical protein A0H81_02130 [Grifola frondosa]|uniref:F-box domain-containing protein n=1 Tax=Grifola frondosa TaxID=5627 RepID=A0A1C7MN56_GRIFR|nr:hypothetical protein A0H81_02130 [Grifola frondosa]